MIMELGFITALAIGAYYMRKFWDDIRDWLNMTAANAVEKCFGYSARQNMVKAVSAVDRLVSKLKNHSVVYSKRNNRDLYYDKTTIESEMSVQEVDSKVLAEFDKRNQRLEMEFKYQG